MSEAGGPKAQRPHKISFLEHSPDGRQTILKRFAAGRRPEASVLLASRRPPSARAFVVSVVAASAAAMAAETAHFEI